MIQKDFFLAMKHAFLLELFGGAVGVMVQILVGKTIAGDAEKEGVVNSFYCKIKYLLPTAFTSSG